MGMLIKLKETNISTKHNRLKKSQLAAGGWGGGADQLAIYTHNWWLERESTEKQLQLRGQSGTWSRDLQISSLRRNHSPTRRPRLKKYCIMLVIKLVWEDRVGIFWQFCFFSSLQRAPVLEAWVGLRPGRPCTRIEKEVMKFKDKVGRERSLKVSRRTLCFIAILGIKTLVLYII